MLDALLYFLKGVLAMKRNLEKYEELKKLGLKEREIAERFKMSILDFRAWHHAAVVEKRKENRA